MTPQKDLEICSPPNFGAFCSSGCIPSFPKPADYICAADTLPQVIPRSDWQSTDELGREHVHTIYRQLDGHCSSNAAAGAIMYMRSRQGLPHVVLAPEPLYAIHSNWGTGSTLAENLETVATIGIPARDRMPQRNYGRLRDYGTAAEEARRYRVIEWWLCKTFDELCIGLQLGFPAVIGLRWPGGGGHSVLATDILVDGDTVYVEGPNSWGENWGDGGFYRLHERHLNNPGWGWWLGRGVTVPQDELSMSRDSLPAIF